MSVTLTWNFQDTPVGTAVGSLQPKSLNFSVDFAKKETSDGSAVVTNLTSPTDRPETLKWASSRVANVYTGTGIEPSLRSQNKSGVSVVAQLRTVVTATESSTSERIDYPLSAHLVVKVPNADVITGDVVNTLLLRLLGMLYEESGASPTTRLNALIRGALLPKALA
jgi:hypothetical protein